MNVFVEVERVVGRAIPSARLRLLLALTTAAAMIAIACVLVGVALTAPLGGMDTGDPATGLWTSRTAMALAVLCFVGTGPVAAIASGRRALAALPVGVVIVWASGVAVAFLT